MRNKNALSAGRFVLALAALISGVAQASPLPALNSRGEYRVDSFRLTNLRAFAGRDLSVLFVSARERSAGPKGQTLKVRRVMREPVTVRIDSEGNATIPTTLVPFRRSVDGVSLAFNYMIFAVHRSGQDAVYLPPDALDESVPLDPRVPGEKDYSSVHPSQFGAAEQRFVSLLRYIRAVTRKESSGASTVRLDFWTDAR